MASPNQTTVSQLFQLIGSSDSPTLIDVCVDEDFKLDPRLVPGAKRLDHSRIGEVLPQLDRKPVVVICQKGKKLSAGAAALFRSHGIDATYLAGGNHAWRDAGYAMVPAACLPDARLGDSGLWVSGEGLTLDRAACAWLIRRFVDREARFLLVPPDAVDGVSEKFQATPFAMEECFETMLARFQLAHEGSGLMARNVSAMQEAGLGKEQGLAGLPEIFSGLSRMFRDDLKQLEATMLMFDALYRWSCETVNEITGPAHRMKVQPS